MANLGTTELDVFRLCLGGNVFGWTADEEESFAVLDAYAAAGGNFIDTADTYTRPNMGLSETIIGRWMAERGNRDDIVLEGKVRHIAASNLSGERLEESMEVSWREGLAEYVALQPHYNLVERERYEAEYAPIVA